MRWGEHYEYQERPMADVPRDDEAFSSHHSDMLLVSFFVIISALLRSDQSASLWSRNLSVSYF